MLNVSSNIFISGAFEPSPSAATVCAVDSEADKFCGSRSVNVSVAVVRIVDPPTYPATTSACLRDRYRRTY
jgi:hypothetical protein